MILKNILDKVEHPGKHAARDLDLRLLLINANVNLVNVHLWRHLFLKAFLSCELNLQINVNLGDECFDMATGLRDEEARREVGIKFHVDRAHLEAKVRRAGLRRRNLEIICKLLPVIVGEREHGLGQINIGPHVAKLVRANDIAVSDVVKEHWQVVVLHVIEEVVLDGELNAL